MIIGIMIVIIRIVVINVIARVIAPLPELCRGLGQGADPIIVIVYYVWDNSCLNYIIIAVLIINCTLHNCYNITNKDLSCAEVLDKVPTPISLLLLLLLLLVVLL